MKNSGMNKTLLYGAILAAGLVRRDYRAIQDCLCAGVMEIRIKLHGYSLVERVSLRELEPGRPGIVPTGVYVGEAFDYFLTISRDLPVLPVQPRRAVGIEFDQANRKKLHEFAGVIFVRSNIQCGVRVFVAEHAQVDAHGRMQRNDLHQVPVVTECMQDKPVVEVGEGIRCIYQCAELRYDHDFRQGKCNALPQLIRAIDDVAEPDIDPVRLQLWQ